ncbi:MAG: DUF1638 domain-containing protein [Ancalomicrobiaceae bacterium]|nr:DUF1638 domain-containing protein [Ancalomicrobiaceae bacterium]
MSEADAQTSKISPARRGGRAGRLEAHVRRGVRKTSASATLNAWSLTPGDPATRTLVIACGALIAELQQVIRLNGLDHIEVTAVPADYHATPDKIPDAVAAKIRAAKQRYAHVLVGFGDCGTRGRLDEILAQEGVERIEGAHCYAFYAGLDRFAQLHDEAAGTFYLTDFLARHFDKLTLKALKLDTHPELKSDYFGNYTRVVYLAQLPTPERLARAQAVAAWFGLPLTVVETGVAGLDDWLKAADRTSADQNSAARAAK